MKICYLINYKNVKSRFLLLLSMFSLPFFSTDYINAQKIITLKECYESAENANALAGEKAAYASISGLKEENINKGWLPTLDVNGNLVYNSSVIDISQALGALPFPGIADAIKPLPHEQYRITLDVNQILYDGGVIKSAKAVEKADLKVNEKQTETDIYKLRSQINSLYFNIMLIDRQEEILNTNLETINKRLTSVSSAVENGVVTKSDRDIILSEKIKLEQQLAENQIRRTSFLKLLSNITGLDMNESVQFVLPLTKSEFRENIGRPELQLFDLKKEQIVAGEAMTESKRMPKAFGFATLGYGNPPGNNFFKNEFAPYYIIGAGIKWNLFDWNKVRNEKQVLSLQKNVIENRKKDFTDNLKRQLETKRAEIESLEKMMETDNELISIRKRVSASAESQYQNGTITATDYLNILNSERQALINSEIHKINLALAGIEYRNISGQEIE